MLAKRANLKLLMVEETTWGTKPTITAGDSVRIPFDTESLGASQERQQNPHLKGDRNPARGVLGRVDAGGDISCKLNGLDHGLLLKALLGSVTTTGTGPYTHTFKIGSSLPSFTIEKGFADIGQYFVLTGFKCASARFALNPDGFFDLSTTWMGKGEDASSPAASSMDSAPTERTDAVFSMTDANMVIQEGGANIATLTGLEFSYENGLDGNVYTLANQGQRGALPAGAVRITGELTALFEDVSLYNKAKNSTETSIAITLQRGDGSGSAGNEKLQLFLDEILFGKAIPKAEGPAGVLLKLPFEAYYEDAAEASAFRAVLLNSIAAY
ncbi:phage tail tube protein [Deferrisoma camini]|uniref:phage tail tube protein n=1 Tax=Deferrisoma camini TaxID=1035120 RepID=UPI00046D024B|nr:phage tail tube protein [Deferrisoma camini]